MAELIIDVKTYTQFEKVAEQKKSTVEELAEQVIRQYLRREARQMMQREMEAFRDMHAELLAQYLNQYVAIHQGKLVDYDLDELALYLRIDKRYPDIPVLMRQVRPEAEEVLTIRSPRIEYV